MAVIANLDVVLAARTEKLDAGFAKGQKGASKFGSALNSAGESLSGMAPSLPLIGNAGTALSALGPPGMAAAVVLGTVTAGFTAAAAAAVVLGSKIAEQMPIMDEMGKTASSIGIAVGDLQAIRLAIGESTGLAADAVDDSMREMVLRIGEAQQGTGEAAEAFEQLGMNAADLANMSPLEQFQAIHDAVSQIENVSQRNVLLNQIFAENGVLMAAAFADGNLQLEETNAWLEEAGIKLSNVDTKAVEQANNAMARVAMLVDGIFQKMAGEFAPVITVIAEDILDAGSHFGEWSDSLTTAAYIAAGIYGTIKDIATITAGMKELAIGDILEGLDLIAEGAAGNGPGEAIAAYERAREQARLAAEADTAPTGQIDAAAQADAAAAARLMEQFRDPSDELKKRIAEIRRLAESGGIGDRVATQATRAAIDEFESAIAAMPPMDAAIAIAEIQDAFAQGLIDQETFDALQQQIEAIQNASLVGPDDVAAAEEIAEMTDQSANQKSPTFAAVQASSAAGYQAALRNQRAGADGQVAELKRQSAMMANAETILAQIAAGIEQLPPTQVVG